jgi:putative CocE/NonD family hydrolase
MSFVQFRLFLIGMLTGFSALATNAQTPADQPPPYTMQMQWGERIPMRAGGTLHANVYRPREVTSAPCILILTPYHADNYHGYATWFAQRGFAVTVADVRGRGNSDGEFEPFVHERTDGPDAVNWIAKQPWSDGNVVMWGASYLGTDQWATLIERPKALKTIVPTAAAYPGIDYPIFNNVAAPYNIQWLTMTSGVTMNSKAGNDTQSFWRPAFEQAYRAHRPFSTLDSDIGNPSHNFQTWVAHPTYDAYWQAMAPGSSDYAKIDLPILTITGHYDADQIGALEFYRRHNQHGPKQSFAKHYLLIGPWTHGGCTHPSAEFRGLEFEPISVPNMNALHLDWYQHVLADQPMPPLLKDRVTYYVAGPDAEEWRYAASLEAATQHTQKWYLHSEGYANDVFHSGWLTTEAPDNEPADQYIYDPLDTSRIAFDGEQSDSYIDQTSTVALGERGLIYHTPPLSEPLEIIGSIRLHLFLSTDVPDTDIAVSLFEIRPSGTCIYLASDVLRLRYRHSLEREVFLEPGQVERVTFDTFNWFARRLARESRLRILITSPNSMFTQKNYNSGGRLADESGADARTATLKIHHDANHASYLEIPIGRTITEGN